MDWKQTFVFSFLSQIISIVGFSVATAFLPFFVGSLGVPDVGSQAFWSGIAHSAAGFAMAFFAPVWGMLADRYGRKSMVCRAAFAGAVIILLLSFAQTPLQVVILRFLQGVFCGTVAANIALVASVVPGERSGFALGMMQTAVYIGHVIGPLIGGMMADAFGYRSSFRVGAVLTFLSALMVYFGTREKFTPADSKSAAEGPGFMTILFLPGFALSVLILFSVKFGSQVANPSFPLIVKDFIAPDDPLNSITGLVMGSAAISGAIAAAVLGYLSDRIGRRRILLLCCCGAGVAALGHYFAKNLLDLFVVRILHGFMMAGTLPAANAMIHSIVDRRSIGKAYGLSTSLSMLGTAIGPGLGGYLAMRAGIRVPFLVMAASQFLLVLIIMFCFHDRKKQVATLPGT